MGQAVKKTDLDVMAAINEYWNSDRYVPLDNNIGSTGYVQQSMSGEVVTDEMLQHLHDRVVVCKGLRCHAMEHGIFRRWVEWFDEEMWPLLKKKACEFPGLYHFYLEHGMYSDAVIMFDYDAWTDNLATACLLAHGITHDIDGNMIPIDMNDPMLIYIKENSSLQFMRYRSLKAQEEILRLKRANSGKKIRVGIFGGGAEPALWANGMNLEDIEVVIYDTNSKMKGVLEQIMGCSLEELGIDYRIQNLTAAFADESLFETFDIIVYNGVMSYYPELKQKIAEGTWRLLKVGGVMFFDDILMHPDMVFGLKVRAWTVKLVPEKTLEDAIAKNEDILPKAGLTYDHYECQKVRDIPNVLVNWAIKTAA